MTIPVLSELPIYKGKLLTKTDWDNLCQQMINYLTTGNYDFNLNKITSNTYVGLPNFQITTLIAGENLVAGNYVVIKTSDGKVYKGDNSTLTTFDYPLGIVTTSCSSGDLTIIETNYYSSLTSLTAGNVYYIGSAGAITNSQPTANSRAIGIALSSTEIKLFSGYDSYRTYSNNYINMNGSNFDTSGNLTLNGIFQQKSDASKYFTLGSFDQAENTSYDRIKLTLGTQHKSYLIRVAIAADESTDINVGANELIISAYRLAGGAAVSSYEIKNYRVKAYFGVPYASGNDIFIPIRTSNNGTATTTTINYSIERVFGSDDFTIAEISAATSATVFPTGFYISDDFSSLNIAARTALTTPKVIAADSNGLGLYDDSNFGLKIIDGGYHITHRYGTNFGNGENQFGGIYVVGGSKAQNDYVDIQLPGYGGIGTLYISNIKNSDLNIFTKTRHFITLRGTTLTDDTDYTKNGGGGGAAYTVTSPSNELLRITNTYAGTCDLRVKLDYLSTD